MLTAVRDPADTNRGPTGWVLALVGCLALVVLTGSATTPRATAPAPAPAVQAAPAPAATPSPTPTLPPGHLPVITYAQAPPGFPADPDPMSLSRTREGLHPNTSIVAYDAPYGKPLAYLAPTISGVPVTMPIVDRVDDWVAVMLPSANRTIAWTPPGDWVTIALRDQIVVSRQTYQLMWYRDDRLMQTWSVSLGVPATPTPLGRTFILGRSTLSGAVYADTDVFALGAIPDDPEAIPVALRGAHIGIHTWHNDWALGKKDTDGCIRLTKSGQELLLRELIPGTEVVVVDRAP